MVHRKGDNSNFSAGRSRCKAACFAAFVISAPTASPVLAAEPDVEPTATEAQVDVAFGIAASNNYVSRGISQSGRDPVLQGYVEATRDLLYAGVWGSNTNYAGERGAELDLTVGMRPSLDAFSFDLGYAHYLFPGSGASAYGEIYAKAEVSPLEYLTLGSSIFYAPDYAQLGASATYAELSASADIGAGFSASAALGSQVFATELGLENYITWNAGVSYAFSNATSLDVRYIDSDLSRDACASLMSATACGARFVASLTVDSSFSTLAGAAH